MSSATQYRQYMDECLRAAAKAKSAEERRSLLELAQTWHQAATRQDAHDILAESQGGGAPSESLRDKAVRLPPTL
jgi:hypothetical protein